MPEELDQDLLSIQEARNLAQQAFALHALGLAPGLQGLQVPLGDFDGLGDVSKHGWASGWDGVGGMYPESAPA